MPNGGTNKSGGRPRGAKKYKNEVLINIIAGILPNGQYGWDQVAAAYMASAKEDIIRDTDDLKKHWVRVLCNGMKKPTGGTVQKGERIHKCIAIERLILDKTHLGMLSLSPDGGSGSGSEDEGVERQLYTSLNYYSAEVARGYVAPSDLPPLDAPPPLLRPPPAKTTMMRMMNWLGSNWS